MIFREFGVQWLSWIRYTKGLRFCITASFAWRTVFDLDGKQKEIDALQREADHPDFWADKDRALASSKSLASLKEEVSMVGELRREFSDLRELSRLSEGDEDARKELEEELGRFERTLDKEEFRILLSGRYDRSNAICTITAGAGGQDAQDWAAMLLRMYLRYAERKSWDTELVHESLGDMGPEGRIGIKQAVVEIRGVYAYGYLKKENGVHRLVRISPFSSKSLRHTSFASVEVIPFISLAQEKEVEIKPDEIQMDFFRSSGPGGQNVNKRETAVRLTHLPTGIVVACQSSRTQQKNKEKALSILASKLHQLREGERAKEVDALKGGKMSIEWGSQIRSYVLHPYQMVKDHRTDHETSQTERVLDGDLDAFIEAELAQ